MGVGGDGEENVAAGEFAVGEAAAFPAKDEGDVLLGLRQLGGKTGQGNGGGKAVSESGGGADDKVRLRDGVFKGLEAEGGLEDGLGVGGGSLGGGVLEVAGVDKAEVEDAEVVHGAGDGADVFREGRFYEDDAEVSGEVWHWFFWGLGGLFWLGMVGAGRFELPTSWSRSTRAARLRYAPIGYGKGKVAARERRLQRRFLRC